MTWNNWKWLELFEWLNMAEISWKRLEMAGNGLKWLEMAGNWWTLLEKAGSDWRWLGMAGNGCKLLDMARIGLFSLGCILLELTGNAFFFLFMA